MVRSRGTKDHVARFCTIHVLVTALKLLLLLLGQLVHVNYADGSIGHVFQELRDSSSVLLGQIVSSGLSDLLVELKLLSQLLPMLLYLIKILVLVLGSNLRLLHLALHQIRLVVRINYLDPAKGSLCKYKLRLLVVCQETALIEGPLLSRQLPWRTGHIIALPR